MAAGPDASEISFSRRLGYLTLQTLQFGFEDGQTLSEMTGPPDTSRKKRSKPLEAYHKQVIEWGASGDPIHIIMRNFRLSDIQALMAPSKSSLPYSGRKNGQICRWTLNITVDGMSATYFGRMTWQTRQNAILSTGF